MAFRLFELQMDLQLGAACCIPGEKLLGNRWNFSQFRSLDASSGCNVQFLGAPRP